LSESIFELDRFRRMMR